MIDGQLSAEEIRRFNQRDYGRCEQCGEDVTRHVTECLPLRLPLPRYA